MIRFDIAGTVPHSRFCSGASVGEQDISPLLNRLDRKFRDDGNMAIMSSETVIVNFDGIEAATSSYLKSVVLPLLQPHEVTNESKLDKYPNYLKRWIDDVFPMLTGLNDEVIEELNGVLTARGLVCLEVIEELDGRVITGRLVGTLDQFLKTTLGCLLAEKCATATELCNKYASEKISVTGWNNRLADLHRLRLASRTKSGRQWIYEPVAVEVVYGNGNGKRASEELQASTK